MQPELFIVAGAPGSGKSRSFPVSDFGVAFFNADDRAASLNGGSYHEIPLAIRQRVNREFEAFIRDHIERRSSFAYETTLRSEIVFEQAAAAHRNGFQVTMFYLGIEDVAINLQRIRVRHGLGFHAAPEDVLRSIHKRSFENLPLACGMASLGQITLVLYDNTAFADVPTRVYEIRERNRKAFVHPLPKWVQSAIEGADASSVL